MAERAGREELIVGQWYRVFYDDYKTMKQREFNGVFAGRTNEGYYEFEFGVDERVVLINPVIRPIEQSDARP